jgi:hypothetical protein
MCALFQTLSKARDQLPRHGTMRACFWPLTHRLTPAHYRSAISIRPLENFTLVYGGAPTSYAVVVRFGIKTGSRGCASVRSAAGFFVAAICERGRLSRWRYRYTLIGYSRRGVPLTRENLNALVVDLGTPARHDGQPQRW